MKSKAQVSKRFRDFDANLTTRPWIVIGMGLRKFGQIMKFKNYGLWSLIVIVYLFALVRFILLSDSNSYPCIAMNDEYQRCVPLDYYGDFFTQGGTRIFLISIAAIASGGVIGNDMANKSIHLYLSRPISRLDYLIARFIPVFLIMILVTLVPNIMIFTSMWSDSGLKTDWLLDHKWLIFDLIVQAMVYSTGLAIIGLTFSTAIKKENPASAAFFLFIYGSSTICEIFFIALKVIEVDGADFILLLSVSHLLDCISFAIFDAKYYVMASGFPWETDISNIQIGAVFTVIFAGCSGLMYWMIQQMEANK